MYRLYPQIQLLPSPTTSPTSCRNEATAGSQIPGAGRPLRPPGELSRPKMAMTQSLQSHIFLAADRKII